MRFWAIALVLLGIGAVVSGQDVPNLKEDTRLQAQLTIREPLIPLRDLVLRIREATGAPLAVAPEIADDKVCVLVADKPAYEVLTRVAELLRCQWQWGVDGTTYVLRLPAAERQRERDLLQVALRAERQRQREALRQAVDLAQRHSLPQIQQMLESAYSNDNKDARMRHLLSQLSIPNAYCAARAFAMLPETVWERVWVEQDITFGSDLAKWADWPLPPIAERSILQLLKEARLIDEDATRLRSVRVLYQPCSRAIILSFEAVSPEGEQYASGEIDLSPAWGSSTERNPVETHPLCKVWREWQTEPATLRQLPKVKRMEDIPPLAIPDFLQETVLPSLIVWAQRRNLNLYVDVYRVRYSDLRYRPRLATQATPSPAEPFDLDISEIAPPFWLRLDGDTLLARHKDYYWLRPSEIPERLLRPLEEKIARRDAISIDEWAHFATALTTMQTERAAGMLRSSHQAGGRVFHATTIPLKAVLRVLPALRFWASLTPAQRARVQRGEPLPLQRLTVVQRQRFQEALNPPRLSDCLGSSGSAPSLEFRENALMMQIPEYWFTNDVRSLSESQARPERFEMRVSGIALPYAITRVGERSTVVTMGVNPFKEMPEGTATDKGYILSFIADGRERAYVVFQTVPATAGAEVEIPRASREP